MMPWMILIGLATVLLSISFLEPWVLSDSNVFLREFVNQELLATLGFVMAITIASAASLHLELNKLQDETSLPFTRTRRSIRLSAYSLLILFGAAVLLVVVKPLLPSDPFYSAMANSFALLIVYFNLSVLFDLTKTVFAIPTAKNIRARIVERDL